MFDPFSRGKFRNRLARAGLLVTLVGVAWAAWRFLRPVSLFEWDEVLFARALSSYDPAANSPHMPGYPLFVLLTRCLAFFVSDAVVTIQAWSFIAAILAAAVQYRLARRLGLEAEQACVSTIFFVATPAFLWFSTVGLSDTSGVLFAGLILSSLLAGEKRGSALLTGCLVACALGIRTQEIYLFPALFLIACHEWRNNRIRRILSAAVAFSVVSGLIWIPAILMTGASRYWAAFRWQLGWLQYERTQGLALPHAPLRWIVEGWLVRPFGTIWLALLFVACITAGGVFLWRSGNRRAVCYSACFGLSSLLISVFSLNLKNGPRYVLPSLFFLALLAGGVVPAKRKIGKYLLLAPLAFVLGSIIWIRPGIACRNSNPAPVMEVLSEISKHYDPSTTWVYYDKKIQPHAEWVLGRKAFQIFPLNEKTQLRKFQQETTVPMRSIAVYSRGGVVPGNTLFRASWEGAQFRKLTMGRYLRCWACLLGPQGSSQE